MYDLSSLPRSTFIKSLEWTGPRVSYPEVETKGDTYPTTWTENGDLYTSAGDPLWGTTIDGLDVEKFVGEPPEYKIVKVNSMDDYRGWGGDGPKPTGMICVNNILYLAVQNMLRSQKSPFSLVSQHGSDAHIIHSMNQGQFWIPAKANVSKPMFPGHKFGGPAFINFGQNNANARDSYVYAVSADQWDNGSNLRLGRVPNDRIVEPAAWEWVAAFTPNREPVWHRDLENAIPILSLHRCISAPEMVYLAGINRYLFLTWRLHKDFSGDDGSDLIVMESPEPWGPFSMVHFEEYWEEKAINPYCPRVPLKWLKPDHRSGWLQFSGSWSPAGQKAGYYRSHVRPFKLILA